MNYMFARRIINPFFCAFDFNFLLLIKTYKAAFNINDWREKNTDVFF